MQIPVLKYFIILFPGKTANFSTYKRSVWIFGAVIPGISDSLLLPEVFEEQSN